MINRHWLQVLLADALTPADLSRAAEGFNLLELAGAAGRLRRKRLLVIGKTSVFCEKLVDS